jgi:hypothetical protein
MPNTDTTVITPDLPTLISEIDEVKGAWRALWPRRRPVTSPYFSTVYTTPPIVMVARPDEAGASDAGVADAGPSDA